MFRHLLRGCILLSAVESFAQHDADNTVTCSQRQSVSLLQSKFTTDTGAAAKPSHGSTEQWRSLHGDSGSLGEKKVSRQGPPQNISLESYVSAGCTATVQEDTRMILLTVAPPFQGSTALLQLLMSSDKISTLCHGKSWQCEGSKIPCGWYSDQYTPAGKVAFDECLDKQVKSNEIIHTLSTIWDLKRPVLHNKLFPISALGEGDKYTHALMHELLDAQAEVPAAFSQLGVKHLKPLIVMMWMPHCVSKGLSSSMKREVENHVEQEVATLENMKNHYSFWTSIGLPVLVVNYADLLWHPDDAVARISRFLPCIGPLDADYVAKPDKDVFAENQFHVRGSVRSFAVQNDPVACCGFDTSRGVCTDPATFEEFGPQEMKMRELHAYFDKLSKDSL